MITLTISKHRYLTAATAATILLAAAIPVAAQCSSSKTAAADDCTKSSKDIIATAEGAGMFKTLLAAVEAAGLKEALSAEGPYTVFAPTDEAFAALPDGTVEALINDPPKLRAILKYHVVSGKVTAEQVVGLKHAKSLLGQKISIDASSGVRVDGARVIKADVMASNGVIHVISSVMMPDPDIVDVAAEAGAFHTLLKAASAAGMVDALRGEGPMTVFAPTDEAFAKLPKGALESLVKNPSKLRAVLMYHVVPGNVMAADVVKLDSAKTILGQKVSIDADKKVMINDAKVIKTDIKAANGTIHVIDSVLMPKDDVIDIAQGAGSFKTLLTAIEAAGLTDALRSGGPYTVFAPTDEAFAALPEGTLEALLKDKEKLAAVLTYHVVPGDYCSKTLSGVDSAKTLQGSAVDVTAGDSVTVAGATVVKADIGAANGTIHVIDRVMIPPSKVSQGPSSSSTEG